MLTLGLLETDVLYPDLLPDYHSYGWMFEQYFRSLAPDQAWSFRYYQIQQGELPSPGDCDAYLITGSKAGVYDTFPWIAPLQQWIIAAYERHERMIGICFGHQLLAHTLGGFAARSPRGWGIGIRQSAVVELPDWISTPCASFRLIYSHRDQVEQLPAAATRMASCPFCPNAAFFIDHKVLGFQGHPEFTVEYTRRLLPRRQSCIGESTYQQGMATLADNHQQQPVTDSDLIGRWLLDFIRPHDDGLPAK
jgi:GMP synthase-like glutamine amidotransferase